MQRDWSHGSGGGIKRARDGPELRRSTEPDRKRRRENDYDGERQWNVTSKRNSDWKVPSADSTLVYAEDMGWGDSRKIDYNNFLTHGSKRDGQGLGYGEIATHMNVMRPDIDSDHEVDKVYARDHDTEGHFKYVLGESIGNILDPKEPERKRFKLLARIGQGTFGRVFSCWDRIEHRYVAIKIVRAIKKYSNSAMIEIEILQKIKKETENLKKQRKSNDFTEPFHYCLELISWFKHSNHVCMVFDHFGPSVYDFMRENEYRPFPMETIRAVANDTLKSLQFLHDVVGLVHTDLKPENILFEEQGSVLADIPSSRGFRSSTSQERRASSESKLEKDVRAGNDAQTTSQGPASTPSSRSSSSDSKKSRKPYVVPKSNRIRVIDLGSAVYHHDHHGSIICTRNYRPPEVVLRLGWSSPADIWSLGCILLEMYTGSTLFQTHHNIEHLAMMEKSLGPIPEAMITNPYSPFRLSVPTINEKQEPLFTGFRNTAVAKYYEETEDSKQRQFTQFKPHSFLAPAPVSPGSSNVKLMFPTPQTSRSAVNQVSIVDKLAMIVDQKNHPYFYDLIHKMLIHDPAKRITALQALAHPFLKDIAVTLF